MQRDKRGRFVKKAQLGTNIVIINGKSRKIKPGAEEAYNTYKNSSKENLSIDGSLELWLSQPENQHWLEPESISLNTDNNFKFSVDLNDPRGLNKQRQNLEAWNFFGLQESEVFKAPEKIKINATKDGQFIDPSGKNIGIFEYTDNKDLYQLNEIENEQQSNSVESAGMNLTDNKNNPTNSFKSQNKPINKTKLADFLELTRAGIGASVNNKIADRALAAEKPFLQDVSESHRAVYGDYRAQVQGEKAAAQLRNMASKPLTSDGALQSQMMMEAQLKGQQYIDQGNAQDEALIRQTREVAWQQEKENQQQRQAAAMQNRQAMLMSEKNKAQIKNMRDSANFSQIVSPLLAGKEQRLRNKAAQQEYYQDYYDDAMVTGEVWRTYDEGLTDSQKALRDIYVNQGYNALITHIGTDENKKADFNQLQQILNNEILRRKAA